jgi:hypothetical protein
VQGRTNRRVGKLRFHTRILGRYVTDRYGWFCPETGTSRLIRPRGRERCSAPEARIQLGSRHREQSFIVTSEGAERAEIIGRRPMRDHREIQHQDILANIVRNFAQQPQKEAEWR